MGITEDFDTILKGLDDVQLTTVNGRITETVGMLIKAVVPQVKIGEVCLIKREGEPLRAEVVGFTRDEVFLSPLGEMTGIGPSSEVIPTRLPLHVKVGDALLGRVLNGLGEPLDTNTKGPLVLNETTPVIRSPPDPLKRQRISEPISVGIRVIDGSLTTGLGQRVLKIK
jgi:type III secretion protein N (ATPase)